MRNFTQLRPVDDLNPVCRVQMTYAALSAALAGLARDYQGIELRHCSADEPAFDRAKVSTRPVMLGSAAGMGGAGSTGMQSIDTLDQFANLTGGRPMRLLLPTGTISSTSCGLPARARESVSGRTTVSTRCASPRAREPSKPSSQFAATPFDSAEIGLRATISTDKDGIVRLNINIDARDLAFIPDGDAYKPAIFGRALDAIGSVSLPNAR